MCSHSCCMEGNRRSWAIAVMAARPTGRWRTRLGSNCEPRIGRREASNLPSSKGLRTRSAPRCGPSLSFPSAWSSGSGDTQWCVIAVWPRTAHSCICCLRCRICIKCESGSCLRRVSPSRIRKAATKSHKTTEFRGQNGRNPLLLIDSVAQKDPCRFSPSKLPLNQSFPRILGRSSWARAGTRIRARLSHQRVAGCSIASQSQGSDHLRITSTQLTAKSRRSRVS